MKKFISALTSLTIAATALTGIVSTTASAASQTLIDITTKDGDKIVNEITAEKGATIPVTLYVPECAGVNNIMLYLNCFQNDNGETMGEGTAENPATGKVEKNQYLFGNYGFTIKNAKISSFDYDSGDASTSNLFDSGYYTKNVADAGAASGVCIAAEKAWSFLYVGSSAITSSKAGADADSVGAWEAAGGDLFADDFNYSSYTPVTTWDSSVDWAYKHSLATFDLVIPAGVADGVYTIDCFKGEFVNTANIWKENPPTAKCEAKGVAGTNTLATKPLVVKIGDVDNTTTTPTQTTASTGTTSTTTGTTTSSSAITIPEGTIVYDLIAKTEGLTSTLDGNYNVVKVPADKLGSEVSCSWIITGGKGVAGVQYSLDLQDGGVTYVADSFKAGRALKSPTLNDANPDKVEYVYASKDETDIADGGILANFTVKLPDTLEGEAVLNVADAVGNQTINKLNAEYEYAFRGLKFVLDSAEESSTTTTSTTKSEDTTTSTTTSTSLDGTTTTSTTTSTTSSTSTTTTTTVTPGSELLGDSNCDGKVSIADVVLLNKAIAKNATLTDQGKINADANKDGAQDSKDSAQIKRWLAGLDDHPTLGNLIK